MQRQTTERKRRGPTYEVGHHVQKLLGHTDQAEKTRPRVPAVQYNKHSVKLELQADIDAGVMLHHTDRMLNLQLLTYPFLH